MRLHDAVLGLIFIALGAVFIGLTLSFPAFPGQKYGPALFPRILGAGIIICGVLIAWRGRRNPAPDTGHRILSFDPLFRDPGKLISFIAVPLSILAYVFLSEWLGFIPTAFALLLAFLFWFRVKPITALVVAVGMTWAMHWFFGTMMRVPLPRGLYMQLLYGG